MTNEEKIRQACIKANPEIMELKFGCRVEVEGVPILTLVSENRSPMLFVEKDWGKVELYHKDIYKILGREIRLADVLFTIAVIQCDVLIDCKAYDDGKIRITLPNWGDLEFFWNLLKDNLSDQTEETKAFIASLLPE